MSIKYLNLLFAGVVAVIGYLLFAAGGTLAELQLPADYDFPLTQEADKTVNQTVVQLNEIISASGKVVRLCGALLLGLGVVYALVFCFVAFRGPGKSATMALLAAMLVQFWLLSGDAQAAPGGTFSDCDRCPLMVEIPPGSFMMGSPSSEEGREDEEGPVHRVRIAYSFAVGVFEIRFAEWDACVMDGGCGGYNPEDWGGRGRQPVINVSWIDTQKYVRWLSAKTGHAYRLLSEAEWEYAARAGTTTPFHTGRTISTKQAHYGSLGPAVATGSFSPNAFGLYDMHGNVGEWVQDCQSDNYQGAPVDGSAWEFAEETDCFYRMVRGGAVNASQEFLRSAGRGSLGITVRTLDFGFRVARTLTP